MTTPSTPDQIQVPSYATDPYATSYPETLPFWEAAAQGRFLLKTCNHCKKAHWYPRIVCPLCSSTEVDWKQASGRATLYSFSVMEKADPPFALAYVELEEGPIITSNIVGTDFKTLRIGQALSVDFKQTPEGRFVPIFKPA